MKRSPQTEDGFAKLANELLDALLRAGLTGNQWKVGMAIVRKTYGFNKAEDDLSASQIAVMCNIARPHASLAINQLATRNIINKRPGRYGMIVGIQKDYSRWLLPLGRQANASADDDHTCTKNVHVQDSYSGCTELVQFDRTENVHTKDNVPKDNHQKTNSCAPQADREQGAETPAGRQDRATTGLNAELAERFERFYAAYPKKRSRGVAEKAFAKLRPSEELLATMLASLAMRAVSGTWVDPQFIPHPASWLNAQGWLDEIQGDYSPAERDVIEQFNELLGAQMGEVSATVYVPARAALIREFLTFQSRPDLARRFFTFFRDGSEPPPHCGLDWLISRKVFGDASENRYARKAA